jgi:hypothetical protein
MSWETLAAAQQMARELDQPVMAAVVGQGIGELAGDLASKALDRACLVEHDLLAPYTPDAYSSALRQLIEGLKPGLVLFPHTYQVRGPRCHQRRGVAPRRKRAAGSGAAALPGQSKRRCTVFNPWAELRFPASRSVSRRPPRSRNLANRRFCAGDCRL